MTLIAVKDDLHRLVNERAGFKQPVHGALLCWGSPGERPVAIGRVQCVL